jgi:hypothetical protein
MNCEELCLLIMGLKRKVCVYYLLGPWFLTMLQQTDEVMLGDAWISEHTSARQSQAARALPA